MISYKRINNEEILISEHDDTYLRYTKNLKHGQFSTILSSFISLLLIPTVCDLSYRCVRHVYIYVAHRKPAIHVFYFGNQLSFLKWPY